MGYRKCHKDGENPNEPCWGEDNVVDCFCEFEDGGDVYACEGHTPAYEGGFGKPRPYLPESKKGMHEIVCPHCMKTRECYCPSQFLFHKLTCGCI